MAYGCQRNERRSCGSIRSITASKVTCSKPAWVSVDYACAFLVSPENLA
jgi:hypothetical protein